MRFGDEIRVGRLVSALRRCHVLRANTGAKSGQPHQDHSRAGRKLRCGALVGAGFLFLAVSAIALRRAPEPSYAGRSLSEWLLLLQAPQFSNAAPSKTEAADAIRHIGTDAIPPVLAWIQYEIPGWKKLATRLAFRMRLQRLIPHHDSQLERAEAAEQAFGVLGTSAASAIPRLSEMIKDPKREGTRSGRRAVGALSRIGQESVPTLSSALLNPEAPNRWLVAARIREMARAGLDVSLAIPALLKCSQDRNVSAAKAAKNELISIASLHPEEVLPPIGRVFETADDWELRVAAALILGEVPTLTPDAERTLLGALTDPDVRVRSAATNAFRARR